MRATSSLRRGREPDLCPKGRCWLQQVSGGRRPLGGLGGF